MGSGYETTFCPEVSEMGVGEQGMPRVNFTYLIYAYLTHCITIQNCFLGVADGFLTLTVERTTMVEGTRRRIHSPAKLKLGYSKQNEFLRHKTLPFLLPNASRHAVVHSDMLCLWSTVHQYCVSVRVCDSYSQFISLLYFRQ